MTIKEFCEKAIEGGWGEYTDKKAAVARVDRWMDESPLWYYKILLDPLAWQAVGKTQGWVGRDVQIERVRDIGKEKATNAFPRFQKEIYTEKRPSWREQMHAMIDALAEGKTIEEFISTL